MAEKTQLICVGCPIGCPLQLEHTGNEIREITGNECNRGAKYAKQEFTDPRRSLSTTIALSGGLWARLPVKSSAPLPKDRVMEAARIIHELQINAPVKIGQVLLTGLLGEQNINVIALRSMDRWIKPIMS
ncbi:MAG: DUF1667 domain-containing protein [Pseudomonadota bacterium]